MNIEELYSVFLKSKGICTDTRKLKKDELFFALKGDNFDGNEYAEKAIENGAKFAIIDTKEIKNDQCIFVNNVLSTLQKLAQKHRKSLNTPIISLTGSNGKTTSKELINAVLSTKYNTKATIGNLNNHIGVPLTLLNLNTKTEIGIIEMGANHLKEIEFLSSISSPNYGYITNIGKAHLEGFGSEENILIGKTELYTFLKKNNGTVFNNLDDEKLTNEATGINCISFGKNSNAEYQIEFISANPFVKLRYKNTEITSNLIGEYNFTNIAASICIGLHFKVTIEQIKLAIENYYPKINRSELIEKENNKIILDAYNANPSSMNAALDNFEKTKSTNQKTVILGDMFELGAYASKEHQNIVNRIQESLSITKAYLAGNNFSNCKINNKKIVVCKDTKSLIKKLKKEPIKNNYILIKGSRGMALERCVEHL